jgi:hypothetical protein
LPARCTPVALPREDEAGGTRREISRAQLEKGGSPELVMVKRNHQRVHDRGKLDYFLAHNVTTEMYECPAICCICAKEIWRRSRRAAYRKDSHNHQQVAWLYGWWNCCNVFAYGGPMVALGKRVNSSSKNGQGLS